MLDQRSLFAQKQLMWVRLLAFVLHMCSNDAVTMPVSSFYIRSTSILA